MKLFAKLGLALFAALAMLMVAKPSTADAHGWYRHCHHHHVHHWHRHCHCHHHHVYHWRCHHRWHGCGHHPRPHRPDWNTGNVDTGGNQCKGRIDGIATGQGIFGLGTARARQAAITDFEAKANTLFGASYGSFSRARGVRWDCKKNAILQAKCVVTASPCR